MRLHVLGPVVAHRDGDAVSLGGPKQRAVLAMLISAAGDAVSMDRIVDGVWGESAPTSVRASVHSYVSNLRAQLGGMIERVGQGYALEVDASDIDAVQFERTAETGRSLIATNPASAAEILRDALAHWRGRPYADLDDVPGLETETRRLEDLRLAAVEARIDADLAAGRHAALIGELESLTADHPFHEGFRIRQMIALYRDGRQTDALRVSQATRDYLADELGIDPSPELQTVEHRILVHDPDLLRAADMVAEHVALLAVDTSVEPSAWDRSPSEVRTRLAQHDHLLTEAIEAEAGRIFRRSGDTVLAAFPDVPHAARAAVALQRQRPAAGSNAAADVAVRTAIAAGDVESHAGDFHGPVVLRALRFMAAAHDGQIVLTDAAQDALRREAGIQILNLGEHRFRGLGAPVPAYQLVAEGIASDFPELLNDAPALDVHRGIGDAIRGYEIRQVLGRGRFGVVFRAYQPSVGREVAIKAIRPEFSNHPEFVRRFEVEARLVARLEHPYIVTLLDFWRDLDGAYFVMPLLGGGSLAKLRHRSLPVDHARRVLSHVGSALTYAHRQGVIHRDVKPANVLLDGEGNAYLADFGVAMPTVKQEAGLMSASPTFRSPEDRAGRAVDARSDVYSFAMLASALLERRDAASGAPVGSLAEVLQTATAEDPGDRYSSIELFLAALESARDVRVAEALPSAAPTRNPFKGLAAFDTSDVDDFFGRNEEIQQLLALTSRHRLVTVVGPSGSGKSSLVRAGLVPAVVNGIVGPPVWTSIIMTPGRDPFGELQRALETVATSPLPVLTGLADPGSVDLGRIVARVTQSVDGDLLLIVDQFEELYSLADDGTREAFLAAIVAAVESPRSRLRVVTTLRADFFDRPLADPHISSHLRDAHLAIGTPEPERLREAIEGPADAANLEVEPGLAARIAADVEAQPGALPLMEYLLTALADEAVDGVITLDAYSARGGVREAVGRQAETVYGALDTEAQAAAQQVFLRLVTVTDDANDVRRRVLLSELEGLELSPGAVDRVLAAFGDARLLTFDRDATSRSPTVEVAHEALLRDWRRLWTWIAERRASLMVRRRIATAVDEWIEANRDPEALPRGRRLGQFEAWADDDSVALAASEREFLVAAGERRDRVELGKRRRRLAVLAGFGAAAVVALVLAVVALAQRSNAVAEAELANARELILEADRSAEDDPELGIHLALEAIRSFEASAEEVPPAAVNVLRRSVNNQRVLRRVPGGIRISLSADGETVANFDPDRNITLWDTRTWEQLTSVRSPDGPIVDFWFSTEIDELYAAIDVSAEHRLALAAWHPGTGSWETIVDSVPGSGPVAVEVSPDGQVVLVNSRGSMTARSRESGRRLFSVRADPESRPNASHGYVAVGVLRGDRSGLGVFDLETGEERLVVDDLGFRPWEMAFSPGATHVAATARNGNAAVVDLETGQVVWTRSDLTRAGPPLWIGDDRLLVGGELQLKLLDADTGGVIRQIAAGDGGNAFYAALPATETAVVTGPSVDESLVVDVSDARSAEVTAWPAQGNAQPYQLHYVSQGAHLLATWLDFGMKIVSAQTGAVLEERESVEAQDRPHYWDVPLATANGAFVAAGDAQARYSTWAAATGGVVYSAPAGFAVVGVSNDGSLAVIHREAVTTQLVRTPDGAAIAELDAGFGVHLARFSPDGRYVVTNNNGQGEPYLQVFSTDNGGYLAGFGSFEGEEAGWWFEFTPDGTKLVIGGYDGLVRIVDLGLLIEGVPEDEAVLNRIEAHDGFIVFVAVSPDGSMVASTSWEEPAKLWDLDTGEPLGELGSVPPNPMAFHPEEPWVSVVDAGLIKTHTLDLEELKSIAQARLTRAMTEAECVRYLRQPCPAE